MDSKCRQGQFIRQQLIPQSDQFKLDEPFDVVLNLQGEGSKSDIIMDIIFIIDVSGSMSGEKLDLVKKSLILFSDLMCDKSCENQIALISFSDTAQVEMPWMSTTDTNKNFIHDSISQLQIRGSTNIANGFSEAIRQLKNKQNKECVTQVILLSDGGDTYGRELCYHKIKSIMNDSQVNFNYGLLIFGYGIDQDPVLLDNIAKLKNGLYYNIRNIHDAEMYFSKVFKIIENTFAEDLTIVISSINPFEIYSFNDHEFIKIDDKLQTKLELFKIGDTKDYFVQLICKSKQNQITQIKDVVFMNSKLDAKLICQDKKIEENLESPQLNLCVEQNQILHINPQYEGKKLVQQANEAMKQIIEFNKQGDNESVKLITNNILTKLRTSSFSQKSEITNQFNQFVKASREGNYENKIMDLIEQQRVSSGVQPLILHIETLKQDSQLTMTNNQMVQEIEVLKNKNTVSSIKIPLQGSTSKPSWTNTGNSKKLISTTKLTEDEYNGLIALNEKVVIVVFDIKNELKLRLIGQFFQNTKEIKLCILDQKCHTFLNKIVIKQKSCFILFYNAQKFMGLIECLQGNHNDEIEAKYYVTLSIDLPSIVCVESKAILIIFFNQQNNFLIQRRSFIYNHQIHKVLFQYLKSNDLNYCYKIFQGYSNQLTQYL